MCYCPTPTLHLNLALTGDGAFQLSPQKTHSVWFISVLNYGDTENVLINRLLLVIPMLYPCHTHVIIQICVLINHINMPPHTHTHTHTHTKTVISCHFLMLMYSVSFHGFSLKLHLFSNHIWIKLIQNVWCRTVQQQDNNTNLMTQPLGNFMAK